MVSETKSPTTDVTVDDLLAIDPSVRVMVGDVLAPTGGSTSSPVDHAICYWTTDGRIRPRLIQERTPAENLKAAFAQLRASFARTVRSQKEADEAEGGIIIPDYMY